MIINCNSTSINLSQGHVMGVLNITPDSFYDGGKFMEPDKVLMQSKRMLEEGASFIDIGGQVQGLALTQYLQKKKSSV